MLVIGFIVGLALVLLVVAGVFAIPAFGYGIWKESSKARTSDFSLIN